MITNYVICVKFYTPTSIPLPYCGRVKEHRYDIRQYWDEIVRDKSEKDYT